MRSITREGIDRWFDLNLDLESRTIYLGSMGSDYEGNESGVDHVMAEYFIKGMHVLTRKSSNVPINVIMNNPGGDWYHGMAIYDCIKNAPCEVHITAYGYAMSMGSIILQAGDRRILMPNSRFMIHFGYDGRYGHSKIFEKWADEGKRVNHDMENIYLERMFEIEDDGVSRLEKVLEEITNRQKEFSLNYTPAKYKFSKIPAKRMEDVRKVLQDLLNFDTILTPQETIDLGLADEIYGE